MKTRMLRVALTACLIASSAVGCGPEVAALVALSTQTATVVGAVAGTVWLVKSIENVSLDTEKKRLEIQAIQDGIREVHQIDLSDAEYEQVRRTGAIRIGNRDYPVK